MTEEAVAPEATEVVESGVEEAVEETPQEGVELEAQEVDGVVEEAVEGEDVDSEEASAEEKLYEIKVDGEPIKVSLEEMMKGFQLGSAAHKKFQEAAKIQKEARELKESLAVDPIEAAIKAGVSPKALREFMEKYLYEQIKYDEMTPEQKELEDLRKFKTEQSKAEEERQLQLQQAQQQKEVEYYQEQFVDNYSKALESAGVPKTENAISRIAQIQLDAMESGWEMPVEMAVDQFAKEQRSAVDNYLQSLNEEQIESVIGKEKMKSLRKSELAKLKNPVSSKPAKTTETTKQEERMSASDFFNSLR